MMTREAFKKKLLEFNRLQKKNWARHFKDHPEQLLPGAEVERVVSNEETTLSAEIIGDGLFEPATPA